MKDIVRTRATATFAILFLLTCLSFWLSAGHGLGSRDENPSVVFTVVVVVAFVKVRFVLLDFMELRSAPLALRFGFEAWAAAVAALMITITWVHG